MSGLVQRMIRWWSSKGVVSLLVGLVGCGGPVLYEVQGKIVYADGSPAT